MFSLREIFNKQMAQASTLSIFICIITTKSVNLRNVIPILLFFTQISQFMFHSIKIS